MAKTNNDVLFTYKGVKVRPCNRVTLKLGVADFKRILDEVSKNERLSSQKVLSYSLKPCRNCATSIQTNEVDGNGDAVVINRVCLSVPQGNGVNIIRHSKVTVHEG